jgi:DNA mismatch endonuclease Vsr
VISGKQRARRALRRLVTPLPETTARMKAIRQRDTKPEVVLRKLLHAEGLRFRICPSDLPGRPDVANKSRRWCVFVHGCFWHGHARCKLARLPRTNRWWWRDKITANRKRDSRKRLALQKLGFRVGIVWQCELGESVRAVKKLRRELGTGPLVRANVTIAARRSPRLARPVTRRG